MANINKNIIMQAGAAVANTTNKAAGLSTTTPEPGSIISVIQRVNGGRTIGPDALAHFTDSVRNKLLSLIVNMEPIQSGTGDPSPDNVRPISGRTGLTIYVSPTPTSADATTYTVDWTDDAGTVYGGTLDVVTGKISVDKYLYVYDGTESFSKSSSALNGFYNQLYGKNLPHGWPAMANYNNISAITDEASSMMIPTRIGNVYTQNYGYVYLDSGHNFNVPPEEFGTTVASFKAKLASLYADGTPLTVFCKLATPLTYQLTGQDVVTLVGDNYIWSDSGDVTITE